MPLRIPSRLDRKHQCRNVKLERSYHANGITALSEGGNLAYASQDLATANAKLAQTCAHVNVAPRMLGIYEKPGMSRVPSRAWERSRFIELMGNSGFARLRRLTPRSRAELAINFI